MKYTLIDSDKPDLYRVKALKNFGDVEEGDIGGYVSWYHNLSQEGDCWVYNNAIVKDSAIVRDNAKLYNNATMCNKAEMQGNSRMHNNSRMSDSSKMFDYTVMLNYASMSDQAIMQGFARMFHYAAMVENSVMKDNSLMINDSKLEGSAVLQDIQNLYTGTLDVTCDRVSTMQDSRGYTFLAAYKNNKIIQITAGCRTWNSYKSAKAHFTVNYDSNANVPEVLFILKTLKKMRKLV